MELEKRGIPTVTLCTDAFAGLAREEARALGMPDLALALVGHPLGGVPREAVADKAREALEQVVAGLTREPR